MRVHFVENTCNANYVAVKHLRRAGVDAHLFYPCDEHFQKDPISEDAELARSLPDWLHPYTREDLGSNPYLDISPELLKEMGDCDIIHAQDVGLVWAARTGRPYVWQPHGSDLYFKPFYGYWRDRLPNSPAEVMLVPHLVRQAIRSASAILIQWWFAAWEQGLTLIRDLGCHDRIVHLPFAFVGDQFCPGERPPLSALLPDCRLSPDALLLFHPSRQLVRPDQTEYFGNEKLYQALGRLRDNAPPFALVIVEKGNPDEALAKQVIRDNGIEQHVIWMPQMPRNRLIEWYRAADLTVCELAGGSTGSAGIEALACGCPLMANFLVHSDKATFWPPSSVPPLLNVDSVASIVTALEQCFADRPSLLRRRAESRAWFEANLAAPAVTQRYAELYQQVLKAQPAQRNSAPSSDFRELISALDDPSSHFRPDGLGADQLLAAFEHLAAQARLTERRADSVGWACKALVRALLKQTGLNRILRKHPHLYSHLARRWNAT